MWKLSLFIVAFTVKSQAMELPITIVNSCYDIATKLEGLVTYKNSKEAVISQVIPAVDGEKGHVSTSFNIPQGSIKNIDLALTTLREDTIHADLAATLIAQALYTPQLSVLKSLTITISWQDLKFIPSYNLPPTNTEWK